MSAQVFPLCIPPPGAGLAQVVSSVFAGAHRGGHASVGASKDGTGPTRGSVYMLLAGRRRGCRRRPHPGHLGQGAREGVQARSPGRGEEPGHGDRDLRAPLCASQLPVEPQEVAVVPRANAFVLYCSGGHRDIVSLLGASGRRTNANAPDYGLDIL